MNVPESVIKKFGAVSEQVSLLMAQGLADKIDCDIAISTTGIMEVENKDDLKKPQVFITIRSRNAHIVSHFLLYGDRETNRQDTVNYAFDCLYDFIHKNYLVS